MDLDLYAMAYPDTFIINGNEYNGKRALRSSEVRIPYTNGRCLTQIKEVAMAADCLAATMSKLRGRAGLVSPRVTVRTEATLLRLLKASGATTAEMDEVERDIRRWGRGSTLIDVNETGRRLMRIDTQP
jgi:hypothetical protein